MTPQLRQWSLFIGPVAALVLTSVMISFGWTQQGAPVSYTHLRAHET